MSNKFLHAATFSAAWDVIIKMSNTWNLCISSYIYVQIFFQRNFQMQLFSYVCVHKIPLKQEWSGHR